MRHRASIATAATALCLAGTALVAAPAGAATTPVHPKGSLAVKVTAKRGSTEQGGTIIVDKVEGTKSRKVIQVASAPFTFGKVATFRLAPGSYTVVVRTSKSRTKVSERINAAKTTRLVTTVA
jgi:hypothetical protein